jgi:hypothetical protein
MEPSPVPRREPSILRPEGLGKRHKGLSWVAILPGFPDFQEENNRELFGFEPSGTHSLHSN